LYKARYQGTTGFSHLWPDIAPPRFSSSKRDVLEFPGPCRRGIQLERLVVMKRSNMKRKIIDYGNRPPGDVEEVKEVTSCRGSTENS
jgi:hypothetical protein